MNRPLTYLPAYLGLFASLLLALVCNTFLDIQYGSFSFEVIFWAIVFGWTLRVGWKQQGEADENGKQKQKIVLLLLFVLTLLVLIPKWGFPRAGIYMLAGLQAAQNCVTTNRRQLHFGLLVSAVMVIFAASHYRADWTMLFYLIPYVVAVVFTLVSEQISRHTLNVRENSLGNPGAAGQGVAIAAATALILMLGGLLYLATPQVTLSYLAWRYGQLTNMGQIGQPNEDKQTGEGGATGGNSQNTSPQDGEASPGEVTLPGNGWPTPSQMREAAKRPGMPAWQSATIMQMASLDEAISEALAPVRQAMEKTWKQLKEWLKANRQAVMAGLFALIALILLLACAKLLKEAKAGTWLRTRFDYWYLVKLGRHAEQRAGATQFFRAMERLFVVRGSPRPVTANTREFLGEATRYREEIRPDAIELTLLFERARYGAASPEPEQLSRMRELYGRLFKRLG